MTTSLYRTYSSPNLKGPQYHETQLDRFSYDDGLEDVAFYVIGDRVQVDGHRWASVAYFGETDFSLGDWVGVVLDEPSGNHDGRVHGRQYFQCKPQHGLFVRPYRVSRPPGSSLASSRISSPLDLGQRDRWTKSPASSCYYYDDDYRSAATPSVSSLEKKLRSINQSIKSAPKLYKQEDHLYDNYKGLNDDVRPTQVSSLHRNNTTSGSNRLSRSSTPIGILKHRSPRPQSTDSTLGAKAEELARRLRASIPTQPSQPSVFNFRPKRAQLEEFDRSYSSSPADGVTRRQSFSSSSIERNRQPVNRVEFGEELKRGDRVVIRTERGELTAVLRYLGETNFAYGQWAGVELDEPDGKNDGSVLGHRYFYCPQNYGLFVPAVRVRKLYSDQQQKAIDFKTMRSTIKSPPPARPGSSSKCSSIGTSSPDKVSGSTTCGSSPLELHYVTDNSSSACKRAYSPASNFTKPISFANESPSARSRLFPDLEYENHPSTHHYSNNNQSTFNERVLNYSNKPSVASAAYLDDRQPKFSDADIEYQLKKSMLKPKIQPQRIISSNIEPVKARSVKYTFTSSKHDGNPIAFRTVEYDRI